MFGADLCDGGFGFALGLVNAVAGHSDGRSSRLRIDYRAFLGGGIAHDIELRCASGLNAETKTKHSKSAADDELLHSLPAPAAIGRRRRWKCAS